MWWLTSISIVCVGVAAQAAAPAAAPAPAPPKKHVSPLYSFQTPLTNNVQLSNWIAGGNSFVSPKGLVLQSESTGQVGAFWHHLPITANKFEIFMDVEVRGPPEARNGEGLALWLVSEEDYTSFLKPLPADLWTLYGYKPDFNGYGVYFATSDRSNNPTASISAGMGNGSRVWDVLADVPTGDGVYFNFRNNVAPLNFWLSVSNEAVKGAIKMGSEKEWKPAFSMKVAANSTTPSGYLGFTSSNRRLGKGETTLNSRALFGDSITITKFQLSSDDTKWLKEVSLPGQTSVRDAIKSKDLGTQIEALSDAFVNHMLPKQEMLLGHLNSLQQQNRVLAERIDILQAQLSNKGAETKVNEAIEGLGKMFSKSHQDSVEKLEEIHEKLDDQSVEELKQRSANLENTVKTASTIVTYGTMGLGSAIVVVGLFLFKRMRDMEKKHLL